MRLFRLANIDAIRSDTALPEEVKRALIQMRKAVRDDAERVAIIEDVRTAVAQARTEHADEATITERAIEAMQQAQERVTQLRRENAARIQKLKIPTGKSARRRNRNPLTSDIEYHGE